MLEVERSRTSKCWHCFFTFTALQLGQFSSRTRNTFELGVCPMQLFIFDHVTFIQFKICCCAQNFIKIGWFLAEIWRYNDFENGSRPLSWNCFTTIRDHPRSLCCCRSCLSNFMSIWYTDLQMYYLTFSHIWREMSIQAPKMEVIIHHWELEKAHLCVNSRLLSYQL